MVIRRRGLFLVGLAAALPRGRPTRAAVPRRLAVLDWGLAQTCLALGLVPAGVPAPRWYDRTAIEPPMPAAVPDLGLLFTPNFELLQELAPDAILIPPALGLLHPQLSHIAPVITGALWQPGGDAYALAQSGTLRLAETLGLQAEAAALVARTEAALAEARAIVAGDRPCYLATLLDARNVNLYGAASLADAVLRRLGRRNAWAGAATTRAEFATLGLAALAGEPTARLLHLDSGAGSPMAAVRHSSLWQALPLVREGRVTSLPPVLGSGGLPSAARLARLLAETLTHD